MFKLPDGFTELERLGDGSFGRVELIQREEDGNLFALKILENKAGIASAENEIDLLNLVSTPFIVKLHDVFKTDDYCAIMMDACLGGSLRVRIASRDLEINPFMTNEILETTAQILLALKAIHDVGYVHRDLSPSNILFVKGDSNRIQLIDFGVSCQASACKSSTRGNSGIARGSVGTPSYMSPEMRKGKPHDQSTDMYSLGVIIFEMCELRCPKEGECTSESHPSLDPLLTNLLCEDPENRATVDDCLTFPDIVDVLDQFKNATRIQLTAYDWHPTEFSDDDDEEVYIDEPENEEIEANDTANNQYVSKSHRHWREPTFEEIQAAERAAQIEKEKVEQILKERKEQKLLQEQKQRAQTKITKQKWSENRGDLAKHGQEYNKRLEQVKKQARSGGRRIIPPKLATQPNTSVHSALASSSNVGGVVSADELEKITYQIEKSIGVEKLSYCIKALDEDPLLAPSELGITPRIFDAVSKLMRMKKDVFG